MQAVLRFAAKLAVAYLLLLAVSAWLGQWDGEFLKGRDLWHFTLTRMLVPMVAFGLLAAIARSHAASLLLAALLLLAGTLSAIKQKATGEPLQLSDLMLAEQSTHLFGYVGVKEWATAGLIIPALVHFARNLRFTKASLPVALTCAALLCSYRVEAVAKFIHDHAQPYGLENLTFNQAESERMNGIATHLYFSSAGLWLGGHGPDEMKSAMARLAMPETRAPVADVKPDVYIVLGEAWWRDPSDPNSAIDRLEAAGFAQGSSISPVYGGTTPNAEFEALTAIPVKSFRAGIIPFQHYVSYFTDNTVALPRLLRQIGYGARAYHNYTARFWLRDRVYPRFGFESFDSAAEMGLDVSGVDNWPPDHALYQKVLERAQGSGEGPQFHFIVTVSTHGPFKPQAGCQIPADHGACDYHDRLAKAADELAQFAQGLKARGRPFILVAFGDHLPGIREHQEGIGFKGISDPRMYQPALLVAASRDAERLRDQLSGKPLYCLGPVLTAFAGLGVEDRYFRHMAQACAMGSMGHPEEAVIQNQLFR